MDGSDEQPCGCRGAGLFEVLGEAPVAVQPRQRAFDDPASGQDFEGSPERSRRAFGWTDHLLWHHAAHTVDLFAYQAGPIVQANAIQGPIHPELGIAMDMSIQLKAESGAICTLSLSFNNDGPLGTFFRYIGDSATYIARYDDLVNGKEEPIDLAGVAASSNGIEQFIAAIREEREPNSSVAQLLPCYRVLAEPERQLPG